MRIVDVPPAEFCNAKEIGQHYVVRASGEFRMFNFKECLIDMRQLFPFAPDGRVSKAMFGMYEDAKYDEYFSAPFADLVSRDFPIDGEHCFVLGGLRNYWHFLVDHLSKVPLLTSFRPAGFPLPTVVINPAVTPDYLQLVRAACSLLNLQPTVAVAPRQMLRFKNSFVPCNVSVRSGPSCRIPVE